MMKTPPFFILDGNNAIRVSLPLLCHWVKSRNIEPKAKDLYHCKKNQSSWKNQTDNLKRNTKILNHAYKNSEKIQIIFIDKLIINPQFIGSRQTHRKRRLHRIDLQEHRGDNGIENKRERRSHLATSNGPVGLW